MSNLDREFIGPYRLVRLIRSSQTCDVWEATHETSNRRVAVKMLKSEHRKNREQIAGLRAEFTAGRKLKHPNVIQLLDFNIERNIPYLVEELFTVRTLKQLILEGGEVLTYLTPSVIEQAASGLSYVHKHGWLHRDVKPDNFLCSETGEVKLIDFSIAQKQVRGFARWLVGRPKVQGTRSYMSPEQIRGETLDPRADLYSFGCMVHEMLSGKTPFVASNADDLLSKHLRAPVPSLLVFNENVTPGFAALIVKTLAKQREDRPESIDEFLKEFRKVRVFRTRPQRPASMRAQTDAGPVE